jgi:hypothetical protein
MDRISTQSDGRMWSTRLRLEGQTSGGDWVWKNVVIRHKMTKYVQV